MKESLQIDNLKVEVYETSDAMGMAAADFVQEKLSAAIEEKGSANIILATGASQFKFLKALKERVIDWHKITVFHLDEYQGISDTHPASFRKYLKDRILDAVQPKEVHFLNGDADDLETEMDRYAEILQKHPIDIACIGIGENAHIAFNDPPVADFKDQKLVKSVILDEACRKQQLGEGWFPSLDEVPERALTLTIPAIMACKAISCVVPDERKAEAVYNTLNNEINTDVPATILRRHEQTRMFLDTASATNL
ncbi:glucosamine-6-phosphate deaminase [Pricia sp. S334]|uniref:Glucosamine-6-phosphate deaminase n=1 Tax=Pricia mediterranea TaxID=3076079 RepID=A0ABU3L5K7_9FLAO|nr:glucosamine-6-phosphate deaminase [Pricia sp. S334]MDT7828658.1 glucosamine-6-phosphate deaminase [Pricia sp. S334]